MKIAIECRSPLLQKSLENFLAGHISSIHSCDIVLSDMNLPDRKNVLRIGTDADADIKKPFSKSQLFITLENYYKNEQNVMDMMQITQELDDLDETEAPIEYDGTLQTLEQKIERLTASYVQGVMSLVKEYSEKK